MSHTGYIHTNSYDSMNIPNAIIKVIALFVRDVYIWMNAEPYFNINLNIAERSSHKSGWGTIFIEKDLTPSIKNQELKIKILKNTDNIIIGIIESNKIDNGINPCDYLYGYGYT